VLTKREAKLRLKIDTKTIPTLTLTDRDDDIIWDVELPGFGLRLRRNGEEISRTYVAQYRTSARRSRRCTIGPASILTPAQARTKARKGHRRDHASGDRGAARRHHQEHERMYLGRGAARPLGVRHVDGAGRMGAGDAQSRDRDEDAEEPGAARARTRRR